MANQAEVNSHQCPRGTVGKERRSGSFSHMHPLSPHASPFPTLLKPRPPAHPHLLHPLPCTWRVCTRAHLQLLVGLCPSPGQSRASWVGGWQGLARGLGKRGHPKREGLSAGTSPAREALPGSGLGGPCPPRAHLWGQGWELQVSMAAGCGASALHRERGTVLSRPPRASTQRTSRSRRPPPHEALQGPKSPASQLRRGTGHQNRSV